jgi:hypothetical protein
MASVGAVSKMIRDRERRERRVSPWTLVWLPVTFGACYVGVAVLPTLGGPWQRALWWAAFGTVWVLIVALADHILRRWRHRRKSADAALPRERAHAWRFTLYFCVMLVALQLELEGAGFYQLAILGAAGFAIVSIERVASVALQRRDAERRRREAAELARKF